MQPESIASSCPELEGFATVTSGFIKLKRGAVLKLLTKNLRENNRSY